MTDKALNAYIAGGSKRIAGWFARVDAEIFKVLLQHQNNRGLRGAVAEIGVHHGRSFIAMCLARKANEKGYCVDIFEQQSLNEDSSGRGNRPIFEANLLHHGISSSSIVVHAGSSSEVKPADILGAVDPVRFFSVDGGHWHDIVKSDLALAEGALAPSGIIALDDFHRPEWPDVSSGYFSWYTSKTKPIVPFAIGFNKLYVCEQDFKEEYQHVLAESGYLSPFLSKSVMFQGCQVPVYQRYQLPEEGLKSRIASYARLFAPNTYVRARKALGKSP